MRHALALVVSAVLASIMPSIPATAEAGSPAFPVIEFTYDADGLAITASVTPSDGAALRGELVVDRKSSAGKVSLKQGNEIEAVAGRRAVFGQVKVSFAPGDSLVATASVWRGDELVATVTASTPPME